MKTFKWLGALTLSLALGACSSTGTADGSSSTEETKEETTPDGWKNRLEGVGGRGLSGVLLRRVDRMRLHCDLRGPFKRLLMIFATSKEYR